MASAMIIRVSGTGASISEPHAPERYAFHPERLLRSYESKA